MQPPNTLPRERFFERLESSLADATFSRLVLAKPQGALDGPERIVVRAIALQGAAALSFVYRHATRDITKNFALPEGLAQLRAQLGPVFRHAHLLTHDEDVQLIVSKKGACRMTSAKAAAGGEAPDAAHDREKQRWLSLDRPFLAALGVTTAQHQLIPAMSRKWKQINKFIEVFAGALAASPLAQASAVRVVDFGSGKGYLTFALHDWLRHAKGIEAHVAGVELRPDMVALCNAAISRLGIEGLRIQEGDVRRYQPGPLDVVIALHACDVATDHAIHLGVRAGAAVIMCSPCCHKQVRPQLLSPHPLRPILRHGVHLGQEAEMLTDGLRALLLEACGYDTQVFEFVSLEHTSKNKMILAVRRPRPPGAAAEALRQAGEVKQFYGIREHCLETLLAADGLLPALKPA